MVLSFVVKILERFLKNIFKFFGVLDLTPENSKKEIHKLLYQINQKKILLNNQYFEIRTF